MKTTVAKAKASEQEMITLGGAARRRTPLVSLRSNDVVTMLLLGRGPAIHGSVRQLHADGPTRPALSWQRWRTCELIDSSRRTEAEARPRAEAPEEAELERRARPRARVTRLQIDEGEGSGSPPRLASTHICAPSGRRSRSAGFQLAFASSSVPRVNRDGERRRRVGGPLSEKVLDKRSHRRLCDSNVSSQGFPLRPAVRRQRLRRLRRWRDPLLVSVSQRVAWDPLQSVRRRRRARARSAPLRAPGPPSPCTGSARAVPADDHAAPKKLQASSSRSCDRKRSPWPVLLASRSISTRHSSLLMEQDDMRLCGSG